MKESTALTSTTRLETRASRCMAALVACLALVTPPSLAASGTAAKPVETTSPARAHKAEVARAIEQQVLALQVARYAEFNRDAVAMVAAASMLMAVEVPSGNSGTTESRAATASRLLDRAQRLAGERPDLQALVRQARESRPRGTIEPVPAQRLLIEPGDARQASAGFTAGDDAIAAVIVADLEQVNLPAGELDVDLFVSDDRGAKVCASEAPGLPERCLWTPRRTGKFTATLRNRGKRPVEVILLMN